MKNPERYKKIAQYYDNIDKLKRFLNRDDWSFTNTPRAYIGRYDDNRTDDFCWLATFKGMDMKQLFHEQWRRYIDQFTAEIEKLKKEIANEDSTS